MGLLLSNDVMGYELKITMMTMMTIMIIMLYGVA